MTGILIYHKTEDITSPQILQSYLSTRRNTNLQCYSCNQLFKQKVILITDWKKGSFSKTFFSGTIEEIACIRRGPKISNIQELKQRNRYEIQFLNTGYQNFIQSEGFKLYDIVKVVANCINNPQYSIIWRNRNFLSFLNRMIGNGGIKLIEDITSIELTTQVHLKQL